VSVRLLGSGMGATAMPVAMPIGKVNPEIKAGFTGTPEVVYSPTVPAAPPVRPQLVTNRRH